MCSFELILNFFHICMANSFLSFGRLSLHEPVWFWKVFPPWTSLIFIKQDNSLQHNWSCPWLFNHKLFSIQYFLSGPTFVFSILCVLAINCSWGCAEKPYLSPSRWSANIFFVLTTIAENISLSAWSVKTSYSSLGLIKRLNNSSLTISTLLKTTTFPFINFSEFSANFSIYERRCWYFWVISRTWTVLSSGILQRGAEIKIEIRPNALQSCPVHVLVVYSSGGGMLFMSFYMIM